MASNDGVVSEEINRVSPIVPTYGREIATILSVGAGVGLISAIAYFLLEKYVFAAVLCRSGADESCAQAPEYAMVVAMIIGAIAGLLALVQARVFRPLLVVVGVVIALWGFDSLVSDFAWYWSLLLTVVFFAFTYLLFAWVARIRSFLLASVFAIALIALTRFVVMS